ncbi:MAG: phospho-sugar mutase [Firmicutes bacterium]|nr:phospho-sugar mutase [Bacillota bacterium]
MELKFGTAGIRGIMGPEPGQMNLETVRLATRGVAGWLKGKTCAEPVEAQKDLLVVISRDSRNNSLAFAEETARTLEECGIRALMFEDIMPVPVLSFAVRYLHADAGVMITASHNAKEYNGYKLYGATGGQILPEDAEVVQAEIKAVDAKLSTFPEPVEGIKSDSQNPDAALRQAQRPKYVPDEVYHAYLDAMRRASNAPQSAESVQGGQECSEDQKTAENGDFRPLSVIYTPLNGSGRRPAIETLTADGYDLFVVPEQEMPDGDFTTTGQPNPEFESVYRLALEYAKEKQPDIIVATDPDCDRVGAMAKMNQKEPSPTVQYRLLSGNDLGVLVLSYLCATRDMKGKVFVSSFVSTPLADRIAKAHGMEVIKTPVGFKHIAAEMDKAQENFGYAFEESNGMILGLYTRDKDGVLGARLICQAADYYRHQGSSAAEALDAVNEQYGPIFAKTIDVVVDPAAPKPETKVHEFDDGSKVVVRPSGTEPKIKYYFFAPSPERLNDLRNTFGV